MGLENLKQPHLVSLCGVCSSEGTCSLIRAVNQIVSASGGELNRSDKQAIKEEVAHWRRCPNSNYGDQIISPSPKFR